MSQQLEEHLGRGDHDDLAGFLGRGLDTGRLAVFVIARGPRTIKRANEAAKAMCGWDPTGHALTTVLPDVADSLARRVGAQGTEPGLPPRQTDLRRADDSSVTVEVWVEEVAPARLLVVVRDLSAAIENQRRTLRLASDERARSAELRTLIETMDDAVMVFSAGGDLLLANAGTNRQLGTLTSFADLMAGLTSNDGDLPALAAAPDRATVRQRGTDRWLEMSVWPIMGRLGHPMTYLVVVHDATAAQEVAAAHEAFVNVLAHELRTPVTTIYGNARLLRLAPPEDEHDRTAALGDIEAEADRLYRLIEDLLVLTQAERDVFVVEPEPVDLARAVRKAAESASQRFPEVAIVLRLPRMLPAILAQPSYVEQVARNLISNAAKFSPPGGSVVVTGRRSSDFIEVIVRDRGPGFLPEEAPRLFDLFYRAPSTATLRSGSGVGLYVSRKLVEAMGGRIWARARRPNGSEFGFGLPPALTDGRG